MTGKISGHEAKTHSKGSDTILSQSKADPADNLNTKAFYDKLISEIKSRRPSKTELCVLKTALSKKYSMKKTPTDIEVYLHANEKDAAAIRGFLATKPSRTGSGVAIVAVMSKPFPCPHGRCSYCPGGLGSDFGDVPQSYTGKEPAAMRGARHSYDPYSIIFNRLEQYIVMGQSCQKVELIVMGGTFLSFPEKYKKEFIYLCYRALNDFSRLFFRKNNILLGSFRDFFELPGEVGAAARAGSIRKKIALLKKKAEKDLKIFAKQKRKDSLLMAALRSEQAKNEKSAARCVGLTIETRPDFGMESHGLELLSYGCTRVELGVQSVYDDVLQRVDRGHSVQQAIDSTRVLRNLGFKINYHIMPGLPGSNRKKDLEGFRLLFSSPDFRPDMLKIYPCMVMPGTRLYSDFKKGKFVPLSTVQAAELIVKLKAVVPRYVRIMRIQRDIPSYAVAAGVGITNLRQLVDTNMRKAGKACQCIRCREIKNRAVSGRPEFEIINYQAGKGVEYFVSLVDAKKSLLGFCRLRILPGCTSHSAKRLFGNPGNAALVRELHVYGSALSIGLPGSQEKGAQHKGYGSMLLKKAEEIALSHGRSMIFVISGVGARDYYRRLGYRKQGFYMAKRIG